MPKKRRREALRNQLNADDDRDEEISAAMPYRWVKKHLELLTFMSEAAFRRITPSASSRATE